MDPTLAQAQLEQLKFVLIISGALISILNGGVVYFLKSIHGDFKSVQREQADQRERLAVLEYRMSQVDGLSTKPQQRRKGGE